MLLPEKLQHFVDYISVSISVEAAHRTLDINAARLLGLADAD